MMKVYKKFLKLITQGKSFFRVIFQEYQFRKLLKNYEKKHIRRKYMIEDNALNHPFDAHYIYHPAWAARILSALKPKKHIDVSSIMSFSTVISAFIPTEYYDFRTPKIELPNFRSGSANLVNLPFKSESIESISCMHTLEHIGLGRYGDPLDPQGDKKAIDELQRVTKKNGHIMIVVPVGVPAVVFNAHRIYKFSEIVGLFGKCKLESYSVVLDDPSSGLVESASEEIINKQSYSCGCFLFRRIN